MVGINEQMNSRRDGQIGDQWMNGWMKRFINKQISLTNM